MKIGRTVIDLAISYGLLTQRLEKALRPLGLTMTQLSLLFHFSWKPEHPQTVSQLVQVMGINQPGVTKATGGMVEKGWLKKESDTEDARIKHLYITHEGVSLLEQAKAMITPTLMASFSCLSQSHLEAFASALHIFRDHLNETR